MIRMTDTDPPTQPLQANGGDLRADAGAAPAILAATGEPARVLYLEPYNGGSHAAFTRVRGELDLRADRRDLCAEHLAQHWWARMASVLRDLVQAPPVT